MQPAPTLKVCEVRLYERDVRLRMPFRYGVATLTQAPQAFVRARVETSDGSSAWGMAAELMAPKWFDKNPALDDEENFGQLYTALALAAEAYTSTDAGTAFGISASNYRSHLAVSKVAGLNRLTANFGPAVLDRAVLDGLCRLCGITFYDAVRANVPGILPGLLIDDLSGFDLDAFLAGLRPRRRIHARHTVGLSDPITAADVGAGERVRDGLPQTLEQVVDTYGYRYFKVKVAGDVAQDLSRLEAIAAVLDDRVRGYRVTLDGNERFADLDALRTLWASIAERPALAAFAGSVLFIEQPLDRKEALSGKLHLDGLCAPLMIDESDDDPYAFLQAKYCGYHGVSSKACKGFYKSILNLARCRLWNADAADGRYFLSGEDLSCQAGLAVQQDLALCALLGLEHVERNGHHYAFGMKEAPGSEQRAFRKAHPDLYRTHKRTTCLAVGEGEIALDSLGCPGFASAAEPKWKRMRHVGTMSRD